MQKPLLLEDSFKEQQQVKASYDSSAEALDN